MVHIDEILDPSRVMVDVVGSAKNEVLREMIDRLAATGMISNGEQAHQRIMAREALMTTGVKHGFAFPHAFSEQFDQSFLTLGRVQSIDYLALDQAPVDFIFLLFGPPGHQAIHLRILARVSRLTGQPDMLDRMRQTDTADELMEVLLETERSLTAYPYKSLNPQ
jgi:PTS system nitrogen regulatory IIA component